MELNPQLIDDVTISRICDGYREGSGDLNDDYFQIVSSPFKVLKMKDVCLDKTFVKKLTDEVEALEFLRKNNDLYSLWQSSDLTHHEDGCISKFIQTLRQKIGKLLSQIMNVEFNENFTITASLYKSTDVLLCHDDKCTDRCVAFVFYLTGTGEEEGGSFDMFAKDDKGQPTTVAKSLPTVANSLLCFEVGNYTYHQVSEIKDPTFKRVSLNGWFHADRELTPLQYTDPMPPLLSQVISPGEIFFDEFINILYTDPSTMQEAQKNFEIESQMLFAEFFRSELYGNCIDELKRVSQWKNRGPANRRHYGVVGNVDGLNLKKLVSFLGSPPFFSYLSELTGLTLTPETDDPEPGQLSAKYSLEVQKWGPGDYSMATDNDEFFKKAGLDLYLWFNVAEDLTPENGGSISYIAADENDDEEDDELLSVDPVDNALVLVYRTEDTVKFTKYLNHTTREPYFCIAVTYYESDETNSI
ncbi:hypothetical protein GE061_013273 [Apolygus lucorum]|uniref:uS12 prolyl 3-hydroxylase n=1 Tax=Apolygus lucorum TaxID=248454 RepID=A0A6A4KFC0_APOLU|nr:hypothetical protein GE061_013273 [Apolygus lucorum]